jgi:peroxiredoxin
VNGVALGCAIHALGRVVSRGVLSLVITLMFPAVYAETGFAFDAPRERLLAPGFRLPDLGGTAVGLEDYRGKVVLLHFWATFCTPCLKELPTLEALWHRYRKRGLVILGIAADRGGADGVRKFAGATGVTFPVLLDPEGVVRNRYEVVALPMSYLIGRDGRFSARMLGSQEWHESRASDLIESLLREHQH